MQRTMSNCTPYLGSQQDPGTILQGTFAMCESNVKRDVLGAMICYLLVLRVAVLGLFVAGVLRPEQSPIPRQQLQALAR